MFVRTDDPIRDFETHEAMLAAKLEKCPVCDYCGERITDDHFYEINDERVCPDCLLAFCKDNFKVNNEID